MIVIRSLYLYKAAHHKKVTYLLSYQASSYCLLYIEKALQHGLFQYDAAEIDGTQRREVSDMRVLRFIQKWLCKLWGSGLSLSTGIDSHKWESKIEILSHLSNRCY